MPGDLGFCKFENPGENQIIGIKLVLHSIFRIDGLITNDKFCMTRTGQSQLNKWRRQLRLRSSESEYMVYTTSEKSECGGSHGTDYLQCQGLGKYPSVSTFSTIFHGCENGRFLFPALSFCFGGILRHPRRFLFFVGVRFAL
jgi:hypothetical protein